MLLGAAAGLMPVSAQAQTYKGSFDLPYNVKWDGYNFVAGQYQIWTAVELSGAPLIHLRGPAGVATLPFDAHDIVKPTATGQLRLKEVDGAWVVEEFRTGESGVAYTFRTPKVRHAEIASTTGAAAPEAIVAVASG